MMRCGFGWREIEAWIRNYDKIQLLAVRLIYAQIAFSLIGSLGAFYTGVLLVNLGISLFALVAIESSSQSLARTYALLLFSSIFLDISWFLLFSNDIWNISAETYGASVEFSVKLTLTMQIIGFSVRFLSSLLWIQMYRLGVSSLDHSVSRDTEGDLRNSFISPATPLIARRPSGSGDGSGDVIGGSIYDPAYYSSLFEDGRDETHIHGVNQNHDSSAVGSLSSAETSHLNQYPGRLCHAKDDESAARKLETV